PHARVLPCLLSHPPAATRHLRSLPTRRSSDLSSGWSTSSRPTTASTSLPTRSPSSASRRPPRRRRSNSPPRARPRSTCPTSPTRSEEHTSELQSRENLVCRLLLEKKETNTI